MLHYKKQGQQLFDSCSIHRGPTYLYHGYVGQTKPEISVYESLTVNILVAIKSSYEIVAVVSAGGPKSRASRTDATLYVLSLTAARNLILSVQLTYPSRPFHQV